MSTTSAPLATTRLEHSGGCESRKGHCRCEYAVCCANFMFIINFGNHLYTVEPFSEAHTHVLYMCMWEMTRTAVLSLYTSSWKVLIMQKFRYVAI